MSRALLRRMIKTAALKDGVSLTPAQQRVADKIRDQRALAVAHGTGTGKTLSGIAGIEALRAKGEAGQAIVVVPSSLRSNFAEQGVRKFTDRKVQVIERGSDTVDPKADYVVVSNTLFAEDPSRYTQHADSLVVDEAHHARNQGTKLHKALMDVAPKMKNRVLLTASPVNNAPSDVASLLNIVKGERAYEPGSFDSKYVKPVTKRRLLGLGKADVVGERFAPDSRLARDLGKHFDYDPGNQKLPTVNEETVRVPMTPEQLRAYRYHWGQMPAAVRAAIKRDILPDKRDRMGFFVAIANARVASNNPAALLQQHQGPYSSAKINALLEELKSRPDKPLGDMVYTNFNVHGAEPIAQALREKGLRPSQITGSMNRRQKDTEIQDFKSGKSDVFVTTPTGKEGISLPNVRREFIFDPHWNPEVTHQARGRGIRSDSLADQVDVKHLLAVEPDKKLLFWKRKPSRSVEEWIDSVAKKKRDLQQQVVSTLGQ